jgi:hypothetical protein
MHFSISLLYVAGAFLLMGASPLRADEFNSIKTVASTVPPNGDVNPYGVAIVPVSKGALDEGSVLISNFNNAANQQGTGTTIVEIDQAGKLKVFATITAASLPSACPGGIGLTTCPCCVAVRILTLAGDGINGPWDMTALDLNFVSALFVTNVLNGTVAAGGTAVAEGSVERIVLATPEGFTPREISRTKIASAFPERTDPAALVIGPTEVALGFDGTLFVADTLGNRIAAIPNAVARLDDAGAGTTVSQTPVTATLW